MSILSFLHLADLQFRSSGSPDQLVVPHTIFEDIRQRTGEQGIDFIAVVGDITYSGHRDQYKEATRFFGDLLSAVKLSSERLFMVPGNHDVSRLDGIPRHLLSAASTREAVDELLSDRRMLSELLARFGAYRDFLKHLDVFFNEESLCAVRTFSVGGLCIAILELNSVLFSGLSEHDKGNLVLGEHQVREALDLASEADLRIALCHHPLDWLREFDYSSVKPLLLDNCDFLLHSHHHREGVPVLIIQNNQAVTLFSGRRLSRNEESLTYNIVRLDLKKSQVSVETRQYSPDLGHWVPDELPHRELLARTYAFSLDKLPSVDQDERPDIRVASPHIPTKVFHNLPQPDYVTFVGREEELKQVHRILRPYPNSQVHLVAIDGIGGIGKSALALEVAHCYLRDYDHLPSEEHFEAIIWTSARSTMLTADGIAPRQQVTQTLDDIYTTIAVTLGREDITRVRHEEQDELVIRALTQQRTLLIMDNLETVDDERVNSFLRELPAPTKAIITTRHRIDVAYPVRLVGMSREDGISLITQECAKKGVALTDAEAEKLYARTGGVPLAIVWSVAQMSYGYNAEAMLRRLGQPTGDIARFCFQGAMEHIRGTDAHRLAMVFPLFASDVSREALGYAAGLDKDLLSRDEGLVLLEKLSLLNRQAGRFSSLPLTRSYLEYELAQAPEFGQAAFRRITDYYQRLLTPPQRVGTPYWDGLVNYKQAESLEKETHNLLHVIRQALDTHDKEYKDVAMNMLLSIVHLLYTWRLWDERLQLSHEVCQVAHRLGDPVEVWLWVDAIGRILGEREQFPECIEALETGRVLARQYELGDALLLADIYEASLHARMGKIDLAQEKLECVWKQMDLNTVLECGDPIIRVVATRAVTTAAFLSERQQDYVRQKEWHELELKLQHLTGDNPTPTLCRLADVSLKLKDIAAAEEFLTEALVSASKTDLPEINYLQARMAKRKRVWEEAQQLCTIALQQFTQLGHGRGMKKSREFLASLQGQG